jgi:hypothetical protein
LNSYLKRFAGTLIALIIFVVLLASVLLFDREKQPEENLEKVFPGINTEEITSFSLKSSGSEFTLEKGDGGWIVESGSKRFKADEDAIEGLIQDVKDMEAGKSVAWDSDKLDEYGVVDSETEFSFRTRDAEYPVIIGDKSPVGMGIYIYDLGEGRVLIVKDQYLWGFVKKSPGDFRERNLLGMNKDAVTRITVKVGDFSTGLARKDGKWFVEGGEDNRIADQKRVRELLDSFSGLKADGFENDAPESLENYGLHEPTAEIVFYSNEGEEGVLFGKRKDEGSYFVKITKGEPVYSVSKNYFKILPKNNEDLMRR